MAYITVFTMRILLVEDDTRIAHSIARWLRSESYAVDLARDGKEGEELALSNDYDLIILDIMLPRQDGWTTCAHLRREEAGTPILFLSALGDVDDRIRGLDQGGDDYLVRPFHSGELLARVRALVRRQTDVRASVVERYGLRLDLTTHKATREGKEVLLTAKEYALLELFMMNPGTILNRSVISEHLWEMNFHPQSNVGESWTRPMKPGVSAKYE